jgi:hypothetical protein
MPHAVDLIQMLTCERRLHEGVQSEVMPPHLQVHTITADRVVGGFTGQSERQLREAFAEAEEAAAAGKRVVRARVPQFASLPCIRTLSTVRRRDQFASCCTCWKRAGLQAVLWQCR